jgi:hypothetical protein
LRSFMFTPLDLHFLLYPANPLHALVDFDFIYSAASKSDWPMVCHPARLDPRKHLQCMTPKRHRLILGMATRFIVSHYATTISLYRRKLSRSPK